jgi:hypothetical protein
VLLLVFSIARINRKSLFHETQQYKYHARGKLIHGNTRVLYFDFIVEFGCVGVLVGVLFVCVRKSTGTTPMQLVLCLHYTLQKVSRHVKVKYGLRCMCGGWHNSSKHLDETLNSNRDAYKRTPSFRTFGWYCCQQACSFGTKSSQKGILESWLIYFAFLFLHNTLQLCSDQ